LTKQVTDKVVLAETKLAEGEFDVSGRQLKAALDSFLVAQRHAQAIGNEDQLLRAKLGIARVESDPLRRREELKHLREEASQHGFGLLAQAAVDLGPARK